MFNIKRILFRIRMYWNYKKCLDIVYRICTIESTGKAKDYLNDAKDSLYKVAFIFKKESDK